MLNGGKILDRLIDIAPKGAENVMLGSGNLPVCAEESDKRVPQCLGPASSVHKRSYCPLDRRVIASELEAIAAPPLLDVLPSLGMLIGIESDVSHGAPPA